MTAPPRLGPGLLMAGLLIAAGPPPPATRRPPPPEAAAPATAPAAEGPRRALAGNAAIADQFAMLAFDTDPAAGAMARERLARWQEPIRLYVTGAEADRKLAADTAAVLAKATGVPIAPVAGGSPNLLVAVTDDPGGIFVGPLRELLLTAFSGDAAAADMFTAQVVMVEPCWVLALWGDPAQTIIKAAIVGIDARQPRAGVERCMARKLAGAMGLLGPYGYLPRSVFAPQSGATRYSLEDLLMLRVLYSPALRPGMRRDEAHAAALAALPGLRHR